MSKPFVPNHTYLGRRIGLGKCIGWPFHDLEPRSWLWHWITKICFLHDEVRTTHPITTKRDRFMPIVMLITWLDFGEILLITFFFLQFILKNFGFFSGSNTLGHISGMVGGLIDLKQKGNVSVEYWVYYVTFTIDLTQDLDLVFFKVKFRNSCPYLISCWSDWCEMKRKQINMILGWLYDHAVWPHLWPWPWSFKIRVLNSLISGMG